MTDPPPKPVLDYHKPEAEPYRRRSSAASEFSAKVMIVVMALVVFVLLFWSYARGW